MEDETPTVIYDDDDVIAAIRECCDAYGSVYKWAERVGLIPQNIYEVLNRKRPIPTSIANAVGYHRLVAWVEDPKYGS